MQDTEAIKQRKFLNSLHNDDMVMRNLPLELFRTESDKFNDEKTYKPTCFVQLSNLSWIPIEIKCSKKFNPQMEYLDIKRNQAIRMSKLKGAFLFSSETHYTHIEAEKVIEQGQDVVSDKLEKHCFRMLKDLFEWKPYPQQLILR